VGAQAGASFSEFNEFLALGDNSAFPVRAGEAEQPDRHAYSLRSNADTILPPGAAHRLLGALGHPMNSAEVPPRRPAGMRAILHPTAVEMHRWQVHNHGSTRLYSRRHAIDIYSRAVSDVYQDLFGEGILPAQGAYDVGGVRQATKGACPDNAVLQPRFCSRACTGARRWQLHRSFTRIFRTDLLGYARPATAGSEADCSFFGRGSASRVARRGRHGANSPPERPGAIHRPRNRSKR